MSKNPISKRVLLVHPYGIGDAIFALPFLSALKLNGRAQIIDMILGSRTRQIFEQSGFSDQIMIIDKDRWKAQSKWKTFCEKIRLLAFLRRRRYTHFVDLSMQPEYSFWAKFFLQIPFRTGFNFSNRNPFLTHPLNIPSNGFTSKNMIEYYADLAALMGEPTSDKIPHLKLENQFVESAKAKFLPFDSAKEAYLAISPGGGVTWGDDAVFKQWPIENYAALIQRLKKDIPISNIVVLGTSSESRLAQKFRKLLDAKEIQVIDLCGRTDLLEAAAIIGSSCLFIGNDGGLVHLAATQNTPIIAFYGPADPVVYAPHPDRKNVFKASKKLPCQPCYIRFRYKRDCKGQECLKKFSTEEIYERLSESGFLEILRPAA